MPSDFMERFGPDYLQAYCDTRTARSEGCWLWTGRINTYGYGQLSLFQAGRDFGPMAHRIVYELVTGRDPTGVQLHHDCHVRACVRPDHLREMSSSEHSKHHMPKQQFCRRGHELSGANLTNQGKCRACANLRGERWRQAHPEKVKEVQRRSYERIKDDPEFKRKNQERARRAGAPVKPPEPFCRNGHPFLDETGAPTWNLLVRSDGRRECRECHRLRERERLARSAQSVS